MKKKKSTLGRMLACLLISFCLGFLPVFGEDSLTSAAKTESALAADRPEPGVFADGFQEVLTSGEYTLLYRDDTAEIALRENSQDMVWYSNPYPAI